MTARLAMASQMVGTQEMMLTFARMGHTDEVAKAQIAREAAQEAGRQGAVQRLSITHISCISDFGADFDIGQSREPAPDDGVTWRWVA